MKKKLELHIPNNIVPYPMEYEISAAMLLMNFFDSDVTFIKRTPNSKMADFKILDQIWELKSPIGDSSRTIQNNLRKANKQSSNIIIDLRRCKMRDLQALNRIKYGLSKVNSIKRMIVIKKNGDIIVLK